MRAADHVSHFLGILRDMYAHCDRMSPENPDLEEPDLPYMKPNVTTPFPFDPATCEALFEACDFHKGFFEMSNSGHSHVIQNARVNSYQHGGTHCELPISFLKLLAKQDPSFLHRTWGHR